MKSLASIIKNKSFFQSSVTQGIVAHTVVEISNEVIKHVLNEESNTSARVLYFKNKTITIEFLHVVIAQEIKINQTRVLNDINTKLGGTVVEKINFVQA